MSLHQFIRNFAAAQYYISPHNIPIKFQKIFVFFPGLEAHSQIETIQSFEPRFFLTTPKLKITDSDKLSLGYETMTMLSDSDSGVSHKSHNKLT